MLTSSLIITVHQSLLSRKEEKLVALVVFSSYVRVAAGGFRIIPYSIVVAVVCAQMRSESLPIYHSTGARHSRSSVGDLTRLVATEHVRNNYHSESQYI